MTISVTDAATGPYYPNGATVSFPFDFSVEDASEVRLFLIAADGSEQTIAPASYTVMIAVDREGGTVTTAAPLPADGRPLWVALDPSFEQQILFEDEGPFNSAVLNPLADRAARRALWLRDRVRRSLQVSFGETAPIFPPPAFRTGGRVLGFNAVSGAMEVQGAGAFKGDPGGNVMAIGLFTVAPTLNIPVGADLVQTSGYAARGRGVARYVYDAAIDAAYVAANPRTSFRSANGRGFRLAADVIDPTTIGAAGDGLTNDTAAMKAAFATGMSVHLPLGKTFRITERIDITADNVTVSGGGTIKCADWNFGPDTDGGGTHFRAFFVFGAFVTFTGIVLDATGVAEGTGVENCFVWSLAPFTSIVNCRLVGCPKGTCIYALSAWLNFQGNVVTDCEAAAFARGRAPIISNNIIRNSIDAAIALNGTPCVGAVISGNTIANETGVLIPAMIAIEEGASQFAVIGNVMIGVTGTGISCLNVLGFSSVEGGTISGNVIDAHDFNGNRTVGANPGALLNISEKYRNCVVTGNKLRGAPSGNPNTRMAIIPASGTLFQHNLIDGTDATGITALIAILPGVGGLSIRHNDVRGVPPVNPNVGASYQGRLFLFAGGSAQQPASYGGMPVSFVGGKFYNAAEGINAELAAPGITNLQLWIEGIEDSSCFSLVNAATAIGDRAAFLSGGAWARPHRIGVFTEMYGTAPPAAAGAIPYQNGDTIHYMAPADFKGVVRVPGQWKSFGAVV